MRRLETALQRYAWGKSGSDSMVAQLKKSEDADFEVDEVQTYAELWMGTHPNGPSRVVRDGHEGSDELQGLYGSSEGPGMFLIELLETRPHYLGDQEIVGDLPFMFKVLSINKALSIQAHPDKKLAERLYATRPDLYKDDNHKPEMAVALSDFEGLCGFRPFREIVYHLEIYPELRAMVGAEATAKAFACTSGVREDEEEALRLLFRAFVTANTDVVTAQVNALVERLGSSGRQPRTGVTPCTSRSSSRSSSDVVDEGGISDDAGEARKSSDPCHPVSHNASHHHISFSCNGRGRQFGGSSGGSNENSHRSRRGVSGADDRSGREGSCRTFGHSRFHKSDPGRRYRNVCDIFVEEGDGENEEEEEEGEEDNTGAMETRQTELGNCGQGGGGSAKEVLRTAERGGMVDRGSGGFAEAEARMLRSIGADGGSDDTAEDSVADGVTDHEDVHMEDESNDDAHLHPKADGGKRPGNIPTTAGNNSASTSTTGSNSTDTSSNNSSSSDISAGTGTGSCSNGDIVGTNTRVDQTPRNSPRGKRHLALVRHGAGAAAAAGGGVSPAAFRRRGWSSSKLAFPDVTGHRRESEDLALRELVLRLAAEYPGDIGIMMPLLLNYLRMGEGESFFMAANEPHAYLKGDILEVMARSDNVVRVALTPKHRDVPLLCEILTYHMGAPPIVTPVVVDECCSRYSPPIKDFEMLDIEVPHGQEYATPPVPVAALAIVMAGAGFACDGKGRQRLCRGVAIFIPAKTAVVYSNTGVDPVGAAGGGKALWVCLARSNLYHSSGGEECCG